MKITTVETTDKYTLVALSGYLGVESMMQIESQFRKSTSGSNKSSIVDVSDVSFISSFGIRMFLDSLQVLEKKGKKLVLLGPSPEVKEVLIACEMDTLAGIYDTKEAAVAAL